MLGVHFTPVCVLLLVCSLHFTHSLHFTPLVRSLQSAVRSLRFTLTGCLKNYGSVHVWKNLLFQFQMSKKEREIFKFKMHSKFFLSACRIPSTADTGGCVLEIRECQPQYRNQQHKLTQQHSFWSLTRLNIIHVWWKLKGEITMYKIKKGAKTYYKRSKIERKTKTKYNGRKLMSDPVLKG